MLPIGYLCPEPVELMLFQQAEVVVEYVPELILHQVACLEHGNRILEISRKKWLVRAISSADRIARIRIIGEAVLPGDQLRCNVKIGV